MPIDDKPQTWGSATRALRKAAAAGDIGDEALFGDDPLSPKLQKKAGGGDSSLDYLGHFAGDDVTAEGHNSGAPGGKDGGKLPIRRFHDGAIAKTGFRTIPGTAATGYLDRKTRAMMDAVDAKLGGTVPRGPIGAPVGQPLRALAREAKLAAPKPVGIAVGLRRPRS